MRRGTKGVVVEIEARLFVSLRKDRSTRVTLKEGAQAADLLEALGIPPHEVEILSVNGRLALLDQELNDGDTVSIIPPIGGG